MPAILACPECDARIQPPDGLGAGKKLKCPKCQTVFAVPGPSAMTTKASSVWRPATSDREETEDTDRPERPARARRDRDDDSDEEAARRPKKKPMKKSSGGGLPVIVWLLIVLLLVGGAGVGVYFAFFNKEKDDSSAAKNGDGKDKGGGGEQGEPEGRLTAGNFKKVRVNMSEAEVMRILGQGRLTQDRQVGRTRSRIFEWEDKSTARPTKIGAGFADDFLIDASGTMDGQRVSARTNTPGGGQNNRVTQASFRRIDQAMSSGQPMGRAQIIEVLGEPTRNLGQQMSVNGQQADEALLWRNGSTQITIWFVNGQNIGMKFQNN